MRKITSCVFLLFLFLVSIQGIAQQDRWDLKRCVEYAINNNISIKQSDIDARTAELTFKQAKASQFGQANFNTNLGFNFGRSVNPTTNLYTTSQILSQGLGLNAGATLFNWFSIRRAVEASKLNYEAYNATIDKTKNDVTLNVAAAYLTALLSREQVALSKTKIQLTRNQLDNTLKLVTAGSVPELNAAELESQLALDSSTLIGNQESYDLNILQLKATLSLDAAVPFQLDTPTVESIPVEPISQNPPDLVYAMAEKSFPQQKINDLFIASYKKQVGYYKGVLYPSLSINASLGDNFANDLRRQVITQGPDVQTNSLYVLDASGKNFVYQPTFTQDFVHQPFNKVWTGYGNQLDNNFRQYVGLTLSVPIFNGNQARTNYEKAKLNVQTANLKKQTDLLNLKQGIYQAYYNAVSALEKYEANKKSVSTASRSFDLASKRYNVGLLNTIDYLTNQNNLFTAQINQLLSQYDYVFRMKVLEFYKGLGIKL
jgi:outer membrane protein